MSILSTLGAELKALPKLGAPRDLFTRSQSTSLGGALLGQSTNLDLERLVPDPLQNGVVAACVNAIARALPDAPLLLENRTPSGWQRVDDHPCLDVLRAPNPDHSDADVWGLTSGFKATRGQAFWLLLPDTRGQVGEIHVWNPDRVTTLGSETQFISGYRIQRESGTSFEAERRQVIHFRHLPDFQNPRIGWNPLRTGRPQIAGDNISASYHTSILFNAGVVSLLISLKEGAMSGQVTPDQFQQVLTNIRRAGRERAGGVEGINLPLEVHKLAYSPDEMNVDRLIEYFETRICSVMGVSQRVAGLGSDPTYNNLGEALNDFWERRIVPDRNADAATLNRQWLPLYDLDDGKWRFRFDYSEVPALQENRDALHERVRSDWEKGLVDKQQARALLGYSAAGDEKFARVFYGDKPKTQTRMPENSPFSEVKDWNESQHPRDEIGRFTNSTGSAPFSRSSTISGIGEPSFSVHHSRSVTSSGHSSLHDLVQLGPKPGISSPPNHPLSATPSNIIAEHSEGDAQSQSLHQSIYQAVDNQAIKGDKHRAMGRRIKSVLQRIDKIHRVENVPRIPALIKNIQGYEGYIEERNGKPVEIVFREKATHLEMTVAHEIGHLIDMTGLGDTKGFASEESDALAEFRDTVNASAAVKQLKAFQADGYFHADDSGEPILLDLSQVKSDLMHREIWARAYAQYIANKSNSSIMKEQLETMRKRSNYHNSMQWSDEDFIPIEKAIDKLFHAKEWI